MTLRELVARLGLTEVARRVGVSARTVKGWLRKGVSARYQAKVDAVIYRHVRSARAASSAKQRRTFRDSVPQPPQSELPPEQVKPKAPPAPKKRGDGLLSEGVSKLNTNTFYGEIHTFNIDQPVLLVSAEEIADSVVRLWQERELTFCRGFFLFIRYIPFNPLYKGELIKLQGTWASRWASTEAWSTEEPIRKSIARVIRVAQHEAQRRVIWFYQYQAHLFNERIHSQTLTDPREREYI